MSIFKTDAVSNSGLIKMEKTKSLSWRSEFVGKTNH